MHSDQHEQQRSPEQPQLTTAQERENWFARIAENVSGRSRGEATAAEFSSTIFSEFPGALLVIRERLNDLYRIFERKSERNPRDLRPLYALTIGNTSFEPETRRQSLALRLRAAAAALDSFDELLATGAFDGELKQQFVAIIRGADRNTIVPQLRATELIQQCALDIARLSEPALARMLQTALMRDPEATTIAVGHLCSLINAEGDAKVALHGFLASEKINDLTTVAAEQGRRQLIEKLARALRSLPDHLDYQVREIDNHIGFRNIEGFLNSAPRKSTLDDHDLVLCAFNQIETARFAIDLITGEQGRGPQLGKLLDSLVIASGEFETLINMASFSEYGDTDLDDGVELLADIFADSDREHSFSRDDFSRQLTLCKQRIQELQSLTNAAAEEIEINHSVEPITRYLETASEFLERIEVN